MNVIVLLEEAEGGGDKRMQEKAGERETQKRPRRYI
jgi:hypothetical protein